MRRSWYLFLVMAIAGIGCASSGVVGSHVERGANVGAYRTYDWADADPLPAGDPRFLGNAVFIDHVYGAVDTALRGRGLQRAASGAADLLIHFHATADPRLALEYLRAQGPACAAPACEGRLAHLDQGTLVVDVVDARSGRIVWRGWVQDDARAMLLHPDRIDTAVARMFSRWPAAPQRTTGGR